MSFLCIVPNSHLLFFWWIRLITTLKTTWNSWNQKLSLADVLFLSRRVISFHVCFRGCTVECGPRQVVTILTTCNALRHAGCTLWLKFLSSLLSIHRQNTKETVRVNLSSGPRFGSTTIPSLYYITVTNPSSLQALLTNEAGWMNIVARVVDVQCISIPGNLICQRGKVTDFQ